MPLNTLTIKQSPEGDGGSPAGGAPASAPASAPAASAAPASAPASEPSGSTNLEFKDIESLLSYDPFSKEASGAADGGGSPVPAKTPPGTPPGVTPPGAAAAPQPPAGTPPPAANPEVELLKTQLGSLQAELSTLRGTPPGGPPASSPPPAGAEEIPREYDFAIPANVMQLVDSENPVERQQGMAMLLKGTAVTVHRTMMSQVANVVSEMARAIPNVINEQLQSYQQAQAIFQDFYGEYKDLNRPELRGLVQETAKQVMTETGLKSWSPQLRVAIASRVYGVLGRSVPGAVPLINPPPIVPGGGARPGAGPTVQGDLIDTLFGQDGQRVN